MFVCLVAVSYGLVCVLVGGICGGLYLVDFRLYFGFFYIWV